jgi:transcription antitermination factor NusG
MKKNWYVVYTKSHCEVKVAALLTKKKIENYCPLNQIISSHGNKKKIVQEALFPSFVFVKATDMEMPLIRQTGSVVDFVYWLGSPVIIKVAEIESMRSFTSQYYNIKLEKANVNINGNVRVIGEPHLDSRNSSAVSLRDSNYRISLPSLGYIMIAETEKLALSEFNYGFERSKMVS